MRKIIYIIFSILMATYITMAQAYHNRRIKLYYYKCKMSTSKDRHDGNPYDDLHYSADSIAMFDNTYDLILYRHHVPIDTLWNNCPDALHRGLYIVTLGTSLYMQDRYMSSGKSKRLKVSSETLLILRQEGVSEEYNPRADHASHMSHYSSSR